MPTLDADILPATTGLNLGSAERQWDAHVQDLIVYHSITLVSGGLPSHTHAQSDVTNLVSDLAGKVPTTRTITAGTGLTGGGDLSANRTISLATRTIGIPYVIDGGGSAITTGQKGYLEIPFACTITGWTILADQSGSIVVDVWKDTYANFPPTVADTIAGSEKPTLSSAQKNQDLTLTTWTTAVSAGDVLAFNVDSAATVTRVLVSLRATIP